jgi:hypothetical protein
MMSRRQLEVAVAPGCRWTLPRNRLVGKLLVAIALVKDVALSIQMSL